MLTGTQECQPAAKARWWWGQLWDGSSAGGLPLSPDTHTHTRTHARTHTYQTPSRLTHLPPPRTPLQMHTPNPTDHLIQLHQPPPAGPQGLTSCPGPRTPTSIWVSSCSVPRPPPILSPQLPARPPPPKDTCPRCALAPAPPSASGCPAHRWRIGCQAGIPPGPTGSRGWRSQSTPASPPGRSRGLGRAWQASQVPRCPALRSGGHLHRGAGGWGTSKGMRTRVLAEGCIASRVATAV